MKTLQSAFIAGVEWHNVTWLTNSPAVEEAAEDYAEEGEREAERNLDRAIEAESELRKADKCGACEKHTLGIEGSGKWCTFCGGKL